MFISYSSSDRAIADSVCVALEQAGLGCWIAPRDVVPGDMYASAIVHAIDAARALVLILSAHSVASSHVLRELERAGSKRHPVIAVRVDVAPMTAGFEYFLNTSQWIDASTGGIDAALPRLVAAIRGVTGLPTQDDFQAAAVSPAPRPRAMPFPRAKALRWTVMAAGFIVLGALLVAVARPWIGRHERAEEVAASDRSVAVLPFVDMSEKHDHEYFGDGLAEDILDLLAKVPGVTVIGRTSSFQFKGKSEDLRSIGRTLSAAYVLEGSVRNSADKVRVTAQLINTRTGAHEWSETYDRQVGDMLKLQDAIAASVVRELQLTVDPRLERGRAARVPEAYDLYLRGRHSADRVDRVGLDEAIGLFQQALERDPAFADAAAELSKAYINQLTVAAPTSPQATAEKARQAANAALKLDPANALAHVTMAGIHVVYDWDWSGAEREIEAAASSAPGSTAVLFEEAFLYDTLGRREDALRAIKAAYSRDPLDADILQMLSTVQADNGDLKDAEAAMRRVLEIRPTYAYSHWNLGLLYLLAGDNDKALAEMQQELIDGARQQGLAMAYFAVGRKKDADAALASLLQGDASAFDLVWVYAYRGEVDKAMNYLAKAYASKDPYLFEIKNSWLVRALGANPRYQALLRAMNFPE